MKSFKEIEFKPHVFGEGFQGIIFFENNYGVSVVRYKNPTSGTYSTYTANEDEWEVAVIYGNENDWEITYNTPITDDVIGNLTESEVDRIMGQVQRL
jgi:hypothetical protein